MVSSDLLPYAETFLPERIYIYKRSLEYMNVFRCYSYLHLGLKVFLVGFNIWMLRDRCQTAAVTFGLFPFYSASVLKLQFILMLLCAIPVFDMNCTCSCMRFTVHKPDNSVGNLPCFYYGFCYFTIVIELEAHLSELYKN